MNEVIPIEIDRLKNCFKENDIIITHSIIIAIIYKFIYIMTMII